MNVDFDLEPYLAKVDFSEALLDRCCVKKATVTGISSLQAVIVEIGGVEYEDIPVWVHTDQGARTQFIKQEALPTAADYFKNAALMFPFPEGVYTNEGLTLKPEVLVVTEVNPDGSIKEVIAVISVLQSVLKTFPDPDDDEAFPTYQPYLAFRIRKAVNTYIGGPSYTFVSTYKYYLWDVIGNKFAEIPTYDGSVPKLPMMDAINITEAQINSFTSGAIAASVAAVPVATRYYGTETVDAWCGEWDDESNLPAHTVPVWTTTVIQNTGLIYEASKANACNQGDYYWLRDISAGNPFAYDETFAESISVYNYIAGSMGQIPEGVQYAGAGLSYICSDRKNVRYFSSDAFNMHVVLYGDYSEERDSAYQAGGTSNGYPGYRTGSGRKTDSTIIGISDGETQELFSIPRSDRHIASYTTDSVVSYFGEYWYSATVDYHEYSEIKLMTPNNFLFSVFMYYMVLLFKTDADFTNFSTYSYGPSSVVPQTPYNAWTIAAVGTGDFSLSVTYGTSNEVYGKMIKKEKSLPLDSQLPYYLAEELVKLNQDYFGDMQVRDKQTLFTGVEFLGLYFKPYDIRIALL